MEVSVGTKVRPTSLPTAVSPLARSRSSKQGNQRSKQAPDDEELCARAAACSVPSRCHLGAISEANRETSRKTMASCNRCRMLAPAPALTTSLNRPTIAEAMVMYHINRAAIMTAATGTPGHALGMSSSPRSAARRLAQQMDASKARCRLSRQQGRGDRLSDERTMFQISPWSPPIV